MADEKVLLARYAERAERYDEMADFMKERVEFGTQLNAEERDMFSAAFKGALTGRRHAVRVAMTVESQETGAGFPDKGMLAAGYRTKVEAELQEVCDKALRLLKERLVPGAEPGEAKTFYLKMMGDYYRYITECAVGESRSRAADEANAAYQMGTNEAASLSKIHPVRLGLALNFSVFQHEVFNDTEAAMNTAQTAWAAARQELDCAPEDQRNSESNNDAILTMQLLQDNLMLWEG
mmetsp:Transcript_35125/g.65043  ORF Transcript_35125/g.65043 Transcript_35125/m.65043 type:complete len:236 (+) Transcript_35125:102-809(+)